MGDIFARITPVAAFLGYHGACGYCNSSTHSFGLHPQLLHTLKNMCIQYAPPERTIKSFDKGILSGLVGLDAQKLYFTCLTPMPGYEGNEVQRRTEFLSL